MKSDERTIQAMAIQAQNAEADKRLAEKKLRLEQKRSEGKDALIADLRKQVADLTCQLNEKVDEIAGMMRDVVGFITGKGAVSLSASVRETVIKAVKEEYERQLQDQKNTYEEIIAALKSEIVRLREGDGNSGTGMSPEERINALEHQVDNLRGDAYGQGTESKYHRRKPSVPADETDVNGEDTPETDDVNVTDEEIAKMARGLRKQKDTGLGKPKPRHHHPLEELAQDIYVDPEDKPDDAVYCGEDVTTRIIYVSGYVKIIRTHRNKYRRGKEYWQVPAVPHETGRMQIDKSLVAYMLYRHLVQHVTIGDLERELRDLGLNFSHPTVMHWFEVGGNAYKYFDIPLHDVVTAEEDVHGDETTLRICDKPILDKDTDNVTEAFQPVDDEDVEEADDIPHEAGETDEHYFNRWLFCFMCARLGLVQYYLHNRGRRSRKALKAYMKKVRHKMYLHSDGALLYKCYDVAEFIIRIACAVHMRRAFYKLKDVSEDAKYIVDQFDMLFHEEERIKQETSDMEERKRLRVLRIGPILQAIKDRLDLLEKNLEKEAEPDLLKAVKYAIKEYPCIMHCLEDASLEWSNNICEQQMRRIATYRNNSFHCGSVASAERFCRMNSLAQSCKMNGKNFQRYIVDTYGKAERIVFEAACAIKEKLRQPLPKSIKEVDWREIVKTDEVKKKLIQLLPHLWEDKYQFAFAYAIDQQKTIQ